MRTLFLDFETHYGTKYSLTQLTYMEYIFHEKFYIQGLSYAYDGETPQWVTAEKVSEFLTNVNWNETILVCHNMHFDASILFWKFGIKPEEYRDTMLMGRVLVPGSASLDALSKAFFPNDKTKRKGKELANFKDVKVLTPDQEKIMAGYCNNDVYVMRELYKVMLPLIPDDELSIMDMTIKMAYNKRLRADINTLQLAIEEEQNKKSAYIQKFTREALMSNQKFADLLRSYGITPPVKISKQTGKETYAFSKKDKGFVELMQDPIARELCEARLAVKSTITETRAQRYIDCMNTLGYLPAFLNYAGARATHRWSGGQKLNIQNMGRGSKLRESLHAPKGYKYVVCDLSQIEVRVLAWLTGNEPVINAFKDKIDPYKAFATDLFSVPLEEVTKDQRQEAKAAVLSLGFQAGAKSFRNVAEIVYGVKLTEERAQEIVNVYRTANFKVAQAWALAQELLIEMANNPQFSYTDKRTGITYLYQAVKKPNGMYLLYDNLHYHTDSEDPSKNGMVYGDERDRAYIYGGKLVQNITQSIARDVIAWQITQIKEKLGLEPVCAVHDELWFIIEEDKADKTYEEVKQIMSTSPDWFTGIPLEAEGGVDEYYHNIK